MINTVHLERWQTKVVVFQIGQRKILKLFPAILFGCQVNYAVVAVLKYGIARNESHVAACGARTSSI